MAHPININTSSMLDQKKSTQIIRDILGNRIPKTIPNQDPSYRHAAVLTPLLEEEGVCKVLFTKRADHLEHHKGQISFPGGSVDEEDRSIEETVLREVNEEIGLQREDVDILGRIDDTVTMLSNFIVHPFVGRIPPSYNFSINKNEVDRLIKVPLNFFYPGNSTLKRKEIGFEGGSFYGPTYEYNGDLIWGATARMMENFMNIICSNKKR